MADSVRIDLTGAGRLVSAGGSHTANPGDFVTFEDLWVDRALRIRKRPGMAPIGGALNTVSGVHEYTYVDLSTGAVTRYPMHGTTVGNAANAIFYFSGGVWNSLLLPITPTANGKWVFCNFDNRVFFANGINDLLVFSGVGGGTIVTAGEDGPPVAPAYSIGSQYTTGTVSVTKGSKTVTGAGTAWNLAWTGTIEIDGNVYTIQQVTGATTLLIDEEYKQNTLAGLTYSLNYGPQSWNLPPRYAYAYYNPTTGHCTNIRAASITASNILEVTQQNQLNVAITIAVTTDYDAFSQGYSEIKLFRTPREGTILVALDMSLNNTANNPVIQVFFTETVTTAADTYLTRFEAPITSNRVPPTGLSALASYQGRLFGLKHNRLYYSLNNVEVGFGVAEECWPERHTIVVNQATALTVVGGDGADDSLIVQTREGDLAIDGWDVRNYRAYNLPTRKSGSYLHSATGKDGSFVCFYADKRLIQYPQGLDIGAPIQDYLDAISDSSIPSVRLVRYTGQHWDLLLIGVGSSLCYAYDYDAARWYHWTAGFTDAATVHNPSSTEELQLWAARSLFGTYIMQWLRKTPVWSDHTGIQAADFDPEFKTHPMRPFEEHDAILKAVHVWVNNATKTWTGSIWINEESSAAVTFTFTEAPHQRQNANGKLLEWVPSSSERFRANTFAFGMTFPKEANGADAVELYVERVALFFDRYQDEPSRGSAR